MSEPVVMDAIALLESLLANARQSNDLRVAILHVFDRPTEVELRITFRKRSAETAVLRKAAKAS